MSWSAEGLLMAIGMAITQKKYNGGRLNAGAYELGKDRPR
jgi:hypothetical protein